MTLVRVMTVRDWRRREKAMSSNELGRARRKPKRRRMEGERRPRSRAKSWSPAIKLGEHIEVRAKAPYRAASLEVKPGLFVVGELRSDALDFGATPVDVTKTLLKAASKGVDALSSKAKSHADKKAAKKAKDKDLTRREASLMQREVALRIREAKVQRAQRRLRQWRAAMLTTGSGSTPLKREAVPWMGDEDLLGDDVLLGDDALLGDDEPYSLQRVMWELHKDDE